MKKYTNQTLVYILAISGIVFSLIVLSSFATQYLARAFNYSKDLGSPIFYGLYNPFNWIFWSLEYQPYYPDFFTKFLMIMQLVVAVPFIVFIIIKLTFIRKAKAIKDLHGSAHWATIDEIKEMGILDQQQGVYIGGYKDKKGDTLYLRHNGPEHVLCYAPSRSGKGVSLVLPTLLSWLHSVLVIDIKGELWALTAGWKKKYAKNKVIKFDPTCIDGSGARFNILEEIRFETPHEFKDTQNIAINLIYKGDSPQDSKTGNQAYFKNEAVSFLTASIIFLRYRAKKFNEQTINLNRIYKSIFSADESIDEFLAQIIECDFDDMDIEVKENIQSIAKSMTEKASQEFSGVKGSLSEALSIYLDPVIAKNTEKSDFKIDDLMNNESPVSLYIIIPPSNSERLKPLNNIIVNQIIRTLIDKPLQFKNGESIKHYKHRLLLMLDEIISLGRLGAIEEQIAYIAGYGIKFYGIVQDIEQLYKVYSDKETITSNCHVRIAFAPNKEKTAQALSTMSGETTIIKKSITSSGKRTAVMLGNVSETIQEVRRNLITLDECMRLPTAKKDENGNIVEAGDMLIFINGRSPIYGKQTLYFKDKTFLARSKVALKPNISDKLKDVV
ncbi:type IV secretory system conjugative DNA transfer family protein [Campylobacter fetus]|uniref:type IV secretory system conjugative DNA transfer family protein n=1 Tax=Campylobacter fetus TaxID=196 RepID=UPI003AF978D7